MCSCDSTPQLAACVACSSPPRARRCAARLCCSLHRQYGGGPSPLLGPLDTHTDIVYPPGYNTGCKHELLQEEEDLALEAPMRSRERSSPTPLFFWGPGCGQTLPRVRSSRLRLAKSAVVMALPHGSSLSCSRHTQDAACSARSPA